MNTLLLIITFAVGYTAAIRGIRFSDFYKGKINEPLVSPEDSAQGEEMAIPEPPGHSQAGLLSKKKGDRFEEYIVRKIHSVVGKNIRFTDWRSDKYINDIKYGPESNSQPDLEYILPTGIKIAVECKWRARWVDDLEGDIAIDIAGHYGQIKKYKKYAAESTAATYIIIGIGWNVIKDEPLEIFIIDVNAIEFHYIKKPDLIELSLNWDDFANKCLNMACGPKP
ncbi:hypothetical protein SAMN05428967_1292 [Phyllobacterium sp. YR620]|uniref:hypothetical protein n=1 Tax=Phyllobacterium sp. YR620 TaxID=1881066 RepID=UPI000886A9FC|nr:hypothetical protein [Phyllobacterium sp. YR620]SDP12504.1 hypothetical protein SAMN05428967_1292 [Phyllobacterium sp. YR620]